MSDYLKNVIVDHNKRMIALERRIQFLETIIKTIRVEETNDTHIDILRSMPLNKPVTREEIQFPTWMAIRTQTKYMTCLIYNGFVKKISDGRGAKYLKIKDIDHSSHESQTHETQIPKSEVSSDIPYKSNGAQPSAPTP